MNDRDISFVVKLIACTASFIICSVVVFMLFGLFDTRVDNKEIFRVIGPAFAGLVGGFTTIMGAIGAMLAIKKGNEKDSDP